MMWLACCVFIPWYILYIHDQSSFVFHELVRAPEPFVRDYNSWTPLHHAVDAGQLPLVEVLLEAASTSAVCARRTEICRIHGMSKALYRYDMHICMCMHVYASIYLSIYIYTYVRILCM